MYVFRLQDLSSLYLAIYSGFSSILASFYVLVYQLDTNVLLDVFGQVNSFALAGIFCYFFEKLANKAFKLKSFLLAL